MVGLLVCYSYLYTIWIKKDNGESKFLSNLRSIGTALVFLFLIYVLFNLEGKYKKNELDKYGVVVKGRVIDIEKSGFRIPHYYAIFEYSFDKIKYLQSINDDERVFKSPDSLTIRCSSHDPELCNVIAYLPW